MANRTYRDQHHVTVAVRFERNDYDALIAAAGTEGRALQAMRLDAQRWLWSLLERSTTSNAAPSSSRRA